MTQFHTLTGSEVEATKAAIKRLSGLGWATPILANLERAGGIKVDTMPLLFEIRFAAALLRAGVVPAYEAAGVGRTTVDFSFGAQPRWLVELFSLGETEAARAATWSVGPTFGRLLTSPKAWTVAEPSLDPEALTRRRRERAQSEEGEIVKAVERIVAKATNEDGSPAKFPPPVSGIHSMLVVDNRSVLEGGDCYDRREIAWGSEAIPAQWRHHWITDDGTALPVRGVFDPKNPSQRARGFRDRVHFLVFIAETSYAPDEIARTARYKANPMLFEGAADVNAALSAFPLFGPDRK
jgi:hypothetical protein